MSMVIDGWVFQDNVPGDNGIKTIASKILGKNSVEVRLLSDGETYEALKAVTDFNGEITEYSTHYCSAFQALAHGDEWLKAKSKIDSDIEYA